MSEYPGFDEEQGGPLDPGEVRPSEWTREEVAEVIAEDVAEMIVGGGEFDPFDPERVKQDVERIIEKAEESDSPSFGDEG